MAGLYTERNTKAQLAVSARYTTLPGYLQDTKKWLKNAPEARLSGIKSAVSDPRGWFARISHSFVKAGTGRFRERACGCR